MQNIEVILFAFARAVNDWSLTPLYIEDSIFIAGEFPGLCDGSSIYAVDVQTSRKITLADIMPFLVSGCQMLYKLEHGLDEIHNYLGEATVVGFRSPVDSRCGLARVDTGEIILSADEIVYDSVDIEERLLSQELELTIDTIADFERIIWIPYHTPYDFEEYSFKRHGDCFRSLNADTSEIIQFDTVAGFALANGYIFAKSSGSKFRLWMPENHFLDMQWDVLPFRKGNSWGLVNADGEVLIAPSEWRCE